MRPYDWVGRKDAEREEGGYRPGRGEPRAVIRSPRPCTWPIKTLYAPNHWRCPVASLIIRREYPARYQKLGLEKKVSVNPEARPIFPDSRVILFLFSPIPAAFFFYCISAVHDWGPASTTDKVARGLGLEIISSSLALCGVYFLATIIGPKRLEPLIRGVLLKVAFAGLLLIVGFVLLLLY